MSTERINIALLGIGNVGSTLIKQIQADYSFFYNKKQLDIRFVVIANSSKALFCSNGISTDWETEFKEYSENYTTQDIVDFTKNNYFENLILVDATASEEIIRDYILYIQDGFNVVACNKKANTQHYDFYTKLRKILKQFDRQFHYETNVGAGLPIVNTIRELYYSGEKITKIRGVFSGSLSYIFNRFSDENVPFTEILTQAENIGYTEPDSREDLSGQDVARKLLILAREIETKTEFSDVKITSLLLPELEQNTTKAQYSVNKYLLDKPFETAKVTLPENHVLRYIGEFDVRGNTLETKLIFEPRNSPLGRLSKSDNLIEIYAESYGENPIVIQGAGAGKEVTARGVLSDILKVCKSKQYHRALA